MTKIIIGVVVAAIVVMAGFLLIGPARQGSGVGEVTEIGETFSYTIEGEVSKPGTYVLSDNITMNDLLYAAGGPIHNTDDRTYFDDEVLKPGSSYYIGGTYDASDVCSNQPIVKANINKDSADVLMQINGITSSIASSIISYRTGTGTFRTLEDIMNVYGIGNATYRKVRNFVILHE